MIAPNLLPHGCQIPNCKPSVLLQAPAFSVKLTCPSNTCFIVQTSSQLYCSSVGGPSHFFPKKCRHQMKRISPYYIVYIAHQMRPDQFEIPGFGLSRKGAPTSTFSSLRTPHHTTPSDLPTPNRAVVSPSPPHNSQIAFRYGPRQFVYLQCRVCVCVCECLKVMCT